MQDFCKEGAEADKDKFMSFYISITADKGNVCINIFLLKLKEVHPYSLLPKVINIYLGIIHNQSEKESKTNQFLKQIQSEEEHSRLELSSSPMFPDISAECQKPD